MSKNKLCGKCAKPKQGKGDLCNCGRPTTYKPEFIDEVYAYIKECQDEYLHVVSKYDEDDDTGIQLNRGFRERLKVSLPTRRGFARRIGAHTDSLLEWTKKYTEFSVALSDLDAEQHDRLVNMGVSGEYNPTITKLLLSNNHGYSDKNETTHKGGIRIEDLTD